MTFIFNLLISETKKSLSNFFPQNFILKYLFPQNLTTFLTPTNQIRHYLLCWTKWDIFVYFKAFAGKFTSHLVWESSQLPKSHSFTNFETKIVYKFFCYVNAFNIMWCNQNHIFLSHTSNYEVQVLIVVLMGALNSLKYRRLIAVF